MLCEQTLICLITFADEPESSTVCYENKATQILATSLGLEATNQINKLAVSGTCKHFEQITALTIYNFDHSVPKMPHQRTARRENTLRCPPDWL